MTLAVSAKRKAQIDALTARRSFAALYSAGSTKGNWEATAKALNQGFDPCDGDLRRMIEEMGGELPECKGEVKRVKLLPPRAMPLEANQDTLSRKIEAQENAWRGEQDEEVEDSDRKYWCDKYKTLEGRFDAIALGEVKVTAAEARVLTSITERCFGKVEPKKESERVVSGVLLLPTIGTGSEILICPKCGYVHEQKEEAE